MAVLYQVELYVRIDGDFTRVDIDRKTTFSLNFSAADMNNPTVVKIPFSFQVALPKTDNNNHIFSHIGLYDSRLRGMRSLDRTPFMLYVNNNLYQRGYFQLESVSASAYNIRLYGGLGDYFYTMSDVDERNMRLKNLDFVELFNHQINSETVYNCWRAAGKKITGSYYDYSTGEYVNEEVLSYAPTYQGYYNNFDSGYYADGYYDDQQGDVNWESASKKYAASRDITENERSFRIGSTQYYGEYRSYAQKPMVKVKPFINKIIEVMALPENGGWETELDPTFFNPYNPYWNNLWMVVPNYESGLPSMEDEDGFGVAEEWNQSGIENHYSTNLSRSRNYRDFPVTSFEAAEAIYSINIELPLHFLATQVSGDNDAIDKNYTLSVTAEVFVGNENLGKLQYDYDSKEEITFDTSTTTQKNVTKFRGETNQGQTNNPFYYYRNSNNNREEYLNVSGIKHSDARTTYVFKGGVDIDFTVPERVTGSKNIFVRVGLDGDSNWKHRANNGTSRGRGIKILQAAKGAYSISSSSGSGTRSGANITYKDLIRSEDTCLQFFLSYLKPFGMYFVKDPSRNKVSIQTRNTYFGAQEKLDWTHKIDYSKEYKVSIAPFEYRIGVFKWRDTGTKYEEQYRAETSKEYGSARYDTGYQFSEATHDYLSDNIFSNGVLATDYSNYYLDRTGTLYQDNKTLMHFQDPSGEGVDISYVLCFKEGYNTVGRNFLITDDTGPMTDVGYCWTNEGRAATSYPAVTRVIDVGGGDHYSLNFGRPSTEYSDTELTGDTLYGEDTIYARFWKGYLTDRFSEHNKVLDCHVNLTNNEVYRDLFDKFIYINDTVWVLNKITGFNPLDNSPTKVQLISVQSIDAYLSQKYLAGNFIIIEVDKDGTKTEIYNYAGRIGTNPLTRRYDSSELDLKFIFRSDVKWDAATSLDMDPLTGEPGDTVVNITVPQNDTGSVVSNTISIRWGSTTTIVQIVQVSNWTVTTSSNVGTTNAEGAGKSGPTISVPDGSSVTLTTTGESGYLFGYWSIHGRVDTRQAITLTVTEDIDAEASWFDASVFGWTDSALTIDEYGGTLTNILKTTEAVSYVVNPAPGITAEPTSGYKTQGIDFTVPENMGRGNITHTVSATYSNGYTTAFTILQLSPPYIDIDPGTAEVPALGGAVDVKIQSNTDWVVTDPTGELTIVPSSGTGSGTVAITVPVNILAARTFSVTFATAGGEDSQTLVISQPMLVRTLEIEPAARTVNGNLNTYTIAVQSNSPWRVDIDPVYASYLSATPTVGTGNGSVTVTVDQNAGTASRTGVAVFSTITGFADISATHTVTQEPGYGTLVVELVNPGNIVDMDSDDYYLTVYNGNGSVTDEFGLNPVVTGTTTHVLENKPIGNYSVALSAYSGATSSGFNWYATPATSRQVEVAGGETVTVSYEFTISN